MATPRPKGPSVPTAPKGAGRRSGPARALRLALAGAAALSLLGCHGFGPVDNKTVIAEAFVLRDKAGNTRALLEVSGDGIPQLVLGSQEGQQGAFDEPRIAPEDVRLVMTLSPHGLPSVTLHDLDGRATAVLSLDRSGAPSLVFLSAEGEVRSRLYVREETGAIELRRKDGPPVLKLP